MPDRKSPPTKPKPQARAGATGASTRGADALNAEGLRLARLNRPAEALAALEAATRLAPRFAQAHHNQGWIRAGLGDVAGAEACHGRAVEAEPRWPEPLAHLAALSVRRGDNAAARSFAERALKLDPRQPTALLAAAEAALATGALTEAEAWARRVAEEQRAGLADRAVAMGVLGDIWDRLGDRAEAWAAWEAGNRARLGLAAERFAPAGQPTLPQALTWMIDYFASTSVERWRKPFPATPTRAETGGSLRHVFLVGFPRSGTTLLANVLAAHPAVVTVEERETLEDAAAAFMTSPAALDRLADTEHAALDPWREAYWRRVREAGVAVAGKVLVDRLPLDSLKLPLIARLFPHARVIFALRDPRDVALSCFRRRFNLNPATYELLTVQGAAYLYDLTMRLSALYRDRLGLVCIEARHEALLADFEGETRRLCGLLGLDWSEGLRDFGARARQGAVGSPSAPLLAQGLSRSGVGAWRAYASWLEPASPWLKPWIERFGYPTDIAP